MINVSLRFPQVQYIDLSEIVHVVKAIITVNLVPRAFPLKNGWGPFFKGKALGTRLRHCD